MKINYDVKIILLGSGKDASVSLFRIGLVSGRYFCQNIQDILCTTYYKINIISSTL